MNPLSQEWLLKTLKASLNPLSTLFKIVCCGMEGQQLFQHVMFVNVRHVQQWRSSHFQSIWWNPHCAQETGLWLQTFEKMWLQWNAPQLIRNTQRCEVFSTPRTGIELSVKIQYLKEPLVTCAHDRRIKTQDAGMSRLFHVAVIKPEEMQCILANIQIWAHNYIK